MSIELRFYGHYLFIVSNIRFLILNKKTRLKRRAFRFICHSTHFVLLKRTFGFGDYTSSSGRTESSLKQRSRTTGRCAKEASNAQRKRKSRYGARRTLTAHRHPATKEVVPAVVQIADKRSWILL